MNAERRAAAIEAGAKALNPAAWSNSWPWARDHMQRLARRDATAVIDAALPHLVGEPVISDSIKAVIARYPDDGDRRDEPLPVVVPVEEGT